MEDRQLYEKCHDLFYIEAGVLIRKISVAPNAQKGSEAGGFDRELEYRRVKIGRKSYLTHRIIFLMSNGYLPDLVDHIDGNKTNNTP